MRVDSLWYVYYLPADAPENKWPVGTPVSKDKALFKALKKARKVAPEGRVLYTYLQPTF